MCGGSGGSSGPNPEDVRRQQEAEAAAAKAEAELKALREQTARLSFERFRAAKSTGRQDNAARMQQFEQLRGGKYGGAVAAGNTPATNLLAQYEREERARINQSRPQQSQFTTTEQVWDPYGGKETRTRTVNMGEGDRETITEVYTGPESTNSEGDVTGGWQQAAPGVQGGGSEGDQQGYGQYVNKTVLDSAAYNTAVQQFDASASQKAFAAASTRLGAYGQQQQAANRALGASSKTGYGETTGTATSTRELPARANLLAGTPSAQAQAQIDRGTTGNQSADERRTEANTQAGTPTQRRRLGPFRKLKPLGT